MRFSSRGSSSWRTVAAPKGGASSQSLGVAALVIVAVFVGIGLAAAMRIIWQRSTVEEGQRRASEVELEVQSVIQENAPISFGVYAANLSTGREASVDGDRSLFAASVNKLVTAVCILNQVDQGKLSLDEPLGKFTVRQQLFQLINQSNNDSWDLFIKKCPGSQQQEFARKIGMSKFTWSGNEAIPREIGILLTHLQANDLYKNKDLLPLLLSHMQNTNEEGVMTPALKRGEVIHHKTGFYDGTVNDAAIISKEGATYIIVVMTDGGRILNYTEREVVIQKITRIILDKL